MSLEGNYSFAGIGAAEAKDRENEARTGVPSLDRPVALLAYPLKYLTGLRLANQGSADAELRLAHGSKTKTQTTELLTAASVSSTVYRGRLQFGSVVPGTVVTAAAAGPGALTDDGAGLLLDGGSVQRGTINYATGVFEITFASAVTEEVTATYDHTDWTEFSVAQSQSETAAGSYTETFTTQFGRIVRGSVTLDDGSINFADDGKGNMVQTDAGNVAVQGSIDYVTGVITLTGGSATLSGAADAVTISYSFNPMAVLAVKGGGAKTLALLPGALPEFDNEAWADGVKGETEVALLGQTNDQSLTTNIVTYWAHHVGDDEGSRVREIHSGFAPGGESNA